MWCQNRRDACPRVCWCHRELCLKETTTVWCCPDMLSHIIVTTYIRQKCILNMIGKRCTLSDGKWISRGEYLVFVNGLATQRQRQRTFGGSSTWATNTHFPVRWKSNAKLIGTVVLMKTFTWPGVFRGVVYAYCRTYIHAPVTKVTDSSTG